MLHSKLFYVQAFYKMWHRTLDRTLPRGFATRFVVEVREAFGRGVLDPAFRETRTVCAALTVLDLLVTSRGVIGGSGR